MIKLGTRKATAETNPKNKFKLVLESMSGDADVYTTESTVLENEEEVIKYIQFLNEVADFDDVVSRYKKEDIEELDRIYNSIFDKGNFYDIMDELVGSDKSYPDSDYYATPETIQVFWYDENGNEFAVELDKDGK